jgi:hypothetical protein
MKMGWLMREAAGPGATRGWCVTSGPAASRLDPCGSINQGSTTDFGMRRPRISAFDTPSFWSMYR